MLAGMLGGESAVKPLSAFDLVIERHRVEFQSVIDQAISELTRHFGLQTLDFRGLEFNHFAGTQIDEMVVVAFAQLLVARPPGAKIVSLHNTSVLEQLDSAVNRRDRNPAVNQSAAAKQLLDVRVILSSGQDAGNDPPLLGHAHTFGDALSLDVIELFLRHAGSRHSEHGPSIPQ
jgi:hypothetical protein